MTWHDRFLVGGGLVVFSLPFAVCVVLFLKRAGWQRELPNWRRQMWRVGFWVTMIVACLMPLYLGGMAFFTRYPAAMMAYQNHAGPVLFTGLLAAPLGLTLAAFGKGRLRWITMIAATFGLATLFVALMAASS